MQDDGRVNVLHVPYHGAAPALTHLFGGQVQFYFSSMQGRQATRLGSDDCNALRLVALPDILVLSEFVPGYEATNWYCVGVPKNRPRQGVSTSHSGAAHVAFEQMKTLGPYNV